MTNTGNAAERGDRTETFKRVPIESQPPTTKIVIETDDTDFLLKLFNADDCLREKLLAEYRLRCADLHIVESADHE